MTDDFMEDFKGLDVYYPGSKRKRREHAVVEREIRDGWDRSPEHKRLPNGQEVEMFTAGALAEALNRPLVTVRMWERRGYIPKAPYRMRSSASTGDKNYAGRRLYTRALVERTVALFKEHGVYDNKRINWSHHRDLSIQLLQEWTQIHEIETAE